MSDLSVPDEREKKLTPWVQTLLGRLRTELALKIGVLEMITAENERLRGIIEGKYGTRDGSDTFLVNQDTGAELPLGEAAIVRYGDFYDVRYGHDESVGGRAGANRRDG